MVIGYDMFPDGTGEGCFPKEIELKSYGCDEVYSDMSRGKSNKGKGLLQAKNKIRKGDTFVVWSLGRLSSSLYELLDLISNFGKKGIRFVSLQESIDTSLAGGGTVFKICGALYNFERELILKRSYPGLEAARAKGRLGGRPSMVPEEKRRQIVALYHQKKMPVWKLCKTMGITSPTLYKYIKKYT